MKHCLPVLALLILLAGCGPSQPDRVPVSGTVTIDGKPVTAGSIMVVPEGSRAATGALGPDGRFTLTTHDENDGTVPGTHKVAVTATERASDTSIRWLAPQKYSVFHTSGITVTIYGPTDNLEIKLSGEDSKPFTPFTEEMGE